MNKLLALCLLAACGGSPKQAAAPADVASPHATRTDAPAGNDAPTTPIPDDAASRKHAFARPADGIPWLNGKAQLATDLRLQRIQQGGGFDITDGPVVVVSGKVTNQQHQDVAYWNQHAHRIECAKGADCVVLVHANVQADSRDLLVSDLAWQPLDPSRPDPLVVPLWGDGTQGPNGFLMKMKAGGGPFWHIHRHDYHGVVLAGNVVSYESGHDFNQQLGPGSYWWQPGGNKHTTDCKGPTDCIVYLDFTGAFDVKAVP